MKLDWRDLVASPQLQDEPWTLFHENSKTNSWESHLSTEEVLSRMSALHEVLPYEHLSLHALPIPSPEDSPLLRAILKRRSSTTSTSKHMALRELSQKHLGMMLHCAYGAVEPNNDSSKRSLRTIPSGGALYPLELYVNIRSVSQLSHGLYHFNPLQNTLEQMREGDFSEKVASCMVQPEFTLNSAVQIFITGMFERSTFKYKSRGYRFTLIEAGHLAQNINIVATSLGIDCVNIGGFFDRLADRFLQIDGLLHSTIYMIAIGGDAA